MLYFPVDLHADNFGLDGWHYTFYFVRCYIYIYIFFIPQSILELCPRVWLSVLGTIRSSLVSLLRFVRWDQSHVLSGVSFTPLRGKLFPSILTDARRIVRFSSPAAGVRHHSQPLCSGHHSLSSCPCPQVVSSCGSRKACRCPLLNELKPARPLCL